MPPSKITQVIPPLHDRDRIQGSQSATLMLMEYGDYQCSRSGQVHRSIEAIQQQLGDRMCFVFRHFPQTQIHPQAQRAAESAEAAAAQGKFWEMHDLLYAHQQALDDGDLVAYAAQLQLDIPQFLREMAHHVHLDRIRTDIESGRDNGVETTPTFFIGVRYEGTPNLEVLFMTLLEINCDR